jgi:SAM-dependent methyltransferase
MPKEMAEMRFWRSRHRIDGGCFENGHYERLMLAVAGEPDSAWLTGTVVADFGCGPRGSLVWVSEAAVRIGIDVLAARYATEFPDDIRSHGMVYVTSTERVIPLPSESVDVLFTVNALDHVAELEAMCDELLRILRPGGLLVASLNLDEPPAPSEPQRLTEDVLSSLLLSRLEVESYRTADRPAQGDAYEPFYEGRLGRTPGEPGFLWVRARKRFASAETPTGG